jgi:Uma2 family endonuclease
VVVVDASQRIPAGEHVPSADQRVVMYGVPWSHYETQLALRGESPVPRITYVDGVMELMSPSKDHERIKTYLGHLVVTYAVVRNIDLSTYGSWTLHSAPKTSGIEPDECYIIGLDQSKSVPDLAIEVRWTSGGIDKLEAYGRLGVREVWIWHDERIDVFVWLNGKYERRSASECLPGLDLELVTKLLEQPTVTHAIRALRSALEK